MAKYRALFLEEATEHLAEMSRALIELEKDAASTESIDLVFRMAHSIKSMAASVGYDAVSEVAHALEDRMERVRSAGRVEGPDGLALLFVGLEGLERMLAVVRDEDAAPAADPALVARLAARAPAETPPPKKART
ncbi:MAG: Hpt domain-containing protein [Myxococcales bacterium]|nr:Hpt domain-containing protein [Myxococcales bacterium]